MLIAIVAFIATFTGLSNAQSKSDLEAARARLAELKAKQSQVEAPAPAVRQVEEVAVTIDPEGESTQAPTTPAPDMKAASDWSAVPTGNKRVEPGKRDPNGQTLIPWESMVARGGPANLFNPDTALDHPFEEVVKGGELFYVPIKPGRPTWLKFGGTVIVSPQMTQAIDNGIPWPDPVIAVPAGYEVGDGDWRILKRASFSGHNAFAWVVTNPSKKQTRLAQIKSEGGVSDRPVAPAQDTDASKTRPSVARSNGEARTWKVLDLG